MAVGRLHLRLDLLAVFPHPVGGKTFEFADGHRFELYPHDARTLALRFLRAYATADSRKGAVARNDFGSFLEVAPGNFSDEIRDLHRNGTSLHAFGFLAVQATLGFQYGLLGGKAIANFLEIVRPHLRILLFGIYSGTFCSHFLRLSTDC